MADGDDQKRSTRQAGKAKRYEPGPSNADDSDCLQKFGDVYQRQIPGTLIGNPFYVSLDPSQGKRQLASQPVEGGSPLTKKLKYPKKVTLQIHLPDRTCFEYIADAGCVNSVDALLDLVKKDISGCENPNLQLDLTLTALPLVPTRNEWDTLDAYLKNDGEQQSAITAKSSAKMDTINPLLQGFGLAESSSLVPNSYHVSIELDSSQGDLYFGLGKQSPTELIKSDFILSMNRSNYPVAIKLLKSIAMVSLTGEAIQYLPPITILVESSNGRRLQHRPTVSAMLYAESSRVSNGYLGTYVDDQTEPDPLVKQENSSFPRGTLDTANVGSLSPDKFTFTQVCAPSQADVYIIEFFVLGGDVPYQCQQLVVKHGPPARVKLMHREQGQEIDVLQVCLVDAHDNICYDVYGLELSLELSLDHELGLSKNFTVNPALRECAVLKTSVTVVRQGKADFGVFELSHGVSGMYTLKVFATNLQGGMASQMSITAAEAPIFVSHGTISDMVLEHCNGMQSFVKGLEDCLRSISFGEDMIKQNTATRRSVKEDIRKLEEEVQLQERKYLNGLRVAQDAAHKNEVIQTEQRQPLRSNHDVVHDIRCWAKKGNSAALTLWKAQSGGYFLSPQSAYPGAEDILGLVVMLARVESDDLNRTLSKFMGVDTLLSIVCRTQRGVSALEQYDEHGNIDDRKGLHGFSRACGYRLSGRIDVLNLMDTRPYQREDGPAVHLSHPQKILNIDPPVYVSGEVAAGFLGYAVNLLLLSSEHLQISVMTRGQGVVGLRESLFFKLLGKLEVYDTRQHMDFASKRVRGTFNGAISLDGGVVHQSQRQHPGGCSDKVAISFSLVPPEERITVSLLQLPRACNAFQRSSYLNRIATDLKEKQGALTGMWQRLGQTIMDAEYLGRSVQITKAQHTRLTESYQSITKRVNDVMRAAAEIEANSLSSQVMNTHRMRAFMM